MAHIAFLGTGLMGIGMAGRLLDAGHDVSVYNRTAGKALPLHARGAVIADTPAEAAMNADVIFAMLGDDIASKSLWCGTDGVLSQKCKNGALAIECSTLSHDWVMELSGLIQAQGLNYLDCPVTGLPDAAAAGELTLFLGGSEKTIDKAQPFLKAISTRQINFGDIGAGTAYKLIVNLMGSVQIAAAAEGLLVAERCGLDLDMVAKALASGGSGSPQVARNGALMVKGEHDKDILFTADLRLKDTDYGLRLAHKMGIDAPIGDQALIAFTQLVEDGFGNLAESKLIDSMRKRLA